MLKSSDFFLADLKKSCVFDSDPEKNPDAFKFDSISYLDVLKKNLKIMDLTAVSLCQENDLPMIVFNMDVPDNLLKLVTGEEVGTLIVSPERLIKEV